MLTARYLTGILPENTHTHTHTHKNTCACTQAYTHTHTHTQEQPLTTQPFPKKYFVRVHCFKFYLRLQQYFVRRKKCDASCSLGKELSNLLNI